MSFFKITLWGLFCTTLLSPLHAEDPWGKDAELAYTSSKPSFEPSKTAPCVSEFLINFHQQVISPADGPRSSFFPGSSQYTKQAIIKYGFFKGFLLGCDRLMRENGETWVYPKKFIWKKWTKYDPVK